MAQASSRPLTPPERTLLRLILSARTRQAWLMTGLAALLTGGFVARVLSWRRGSVSEYHLTLALGAVLVVVAAIVLYFGWGLVWRLRADLNAGKAAVLEGHVKNIHSVDNTYGDTITYAFVQDTRVLTRQPLFAGVQDGDRVRVLIAPRARVALAVTPLAMLLLSLVAGCSVGFFPSPVTPGMAPPAPSGAARADFLPIAPLKWTRGAETAVLLTARGELVDSGVFIGTLRADGTFTTRDEQRTLVMEPDGTVHVGPGWDIQIAEDGTATARIHGQPDETTTLAQVTQPRGGRPGLTLEGGSPALRRTSMWILMIGDLLRLQPE